MLSPRRFLRMIRPHIPLIDVLMTYTKNNAWTDLFAGVTIGILLLPQAIGYSHLAHVPPVYGLYTSVTPTIIYAIFGGSHTMSLGTIALCGLITGDIIEDKLDDYDIQTEESVAIALAVAFCTGVLLAAVAILRCGDSLQSYLSPALIGGFHGGAAVHVVVSQLPLVLGLPRPPRITSIGRVPQKFYSLCATLPEANGATIAIALSCGLLIFVTKKISEGRIIFRNPLRKTREPGDAWVIELRNKCDAQRLPCPIPGELLSIIIFEAISYTMKLNDKNGVAIVGEFDNGMLPIKNLDWYVVGDLIKESYMEIVTIAVVTLSLTISDAKMHSEDADRNLHINQEIGALSLANLVSPFFGSYIAGAGISRSAIAVQFDNHGQLTQMYSVLAATIILAAIPLVSYIQTLPQAVLGVVVLMAFLNMFVKQYYQMKQFWVLGRGSDFIIWLLTFTTTVAIDLDYGLLIGLIVTVNTIFQILSKGVFEEYGRSPGSTEFISIKKGGIIYPGVKVVKLESALFFGSKDRFYKQVIALFEEKDNDDLHTPLLSKSTFDGAKVFKTHAVVIDASSMIFIDVGGINKIVALANKLRLNYGVTLRIATASDLVVRMLTVGGLPEVNPEEKVFFPNVPAAVLADERPEGNVLSTPLVKHRSLGDMVPQPIPRRQLYSEAEQWDAVSHPL